MLELSPRFHEALTYAASLHARHWRKDTTIPYVAHLLGVASIALEHGATEDEAIGALLHDAIEDQSRDGATREEIGQKFGPAVLDIVLGCTDAEGNAGEQKPPWEARKEAYLHHIATASRSTRLVSAADKLHNARAILSDHHVVGEAVWGRFKGGKKGTLWYYRALVDALRTADEDRWHAALIDELERVVTELEHRAGAAGGE